MVLTAKMNKVNKELGSDIILSPMQSIYYITCEDDPGPHLTYKSIKSQSKQIIQSNLKVITIKQQGHIQGRMRLVVKALKCYII